MPNIELNSKGIVVDGKTFLRGKLYLEESEKRERTEFNSDEFRIIVDDSSYNFHLFPSNCEKDNKIRDAVKNRINDIIDELGKKNNVEIVGTQEQLKDRLENVESDKILIYTNNKRGGTLKYQKKTVSEIYRYITAYKNGVKYELNFMRFFMNEDNAVNCILNSLQFDRVILDREKETDLKILLYKCLNQEGICYPTSDENMELEQLEQIFNQQQKNFCFNPDVKFDAQPDAITDMFISFISQCEKLENNNFSNKHNVS